VNTSLPSSQTSPTTFDSTTTKIQYNRSGEIMSEKQSPGIYLIIEFDWPNPITREQGQNASNLHEILKGHTWIKESVAASGGIGGGAACIWIFWLKNYAALDRLLHDKSDKVCQAYLAFFSEMPTVNEKIREEVVFL